MGKDDEHAGKKQIIIKIITKQNKTGFLEKQRFCAFCLPSSRTACCLQALAQGGLCSSSGAGPPALPTTSTAVAGAALLDPSLSGVRPLHQRVPLQPLPQQSSLGVGSSSNADICTCSAVNSHCLNATVR